MRDDYTSKPPLRVLMLINLFMPEVFAGGERQCLRLSAALTARGVRPHILTSRSDPNTLEHEVMEGVPVTRLWSAHQPQKGGRHLASSFTWMRQVSKWIDMHRDEIDVIHCHHAKLNAWVGINAAKRIGVPGIVKLGSAGPNFDFFSLEKKRFFYGKIAARRIKRDARAIVGISEEMMADLKAYGVEDQRRIWIPNGVEMPEIEPHKQAQAAIELRNEIGADPRERVAVFAGRMERQKNVETLLRAFAELTLIGIPGRLVLLGDGVLMEEHKRLASTLGLDNRVTFTGRVENVSDYLGASDVFVLPALAEGMSNAVLEAMAAGVPQIVSTVSGNTDLVKHGETGWLYGDPRDHAALTAALKEAFSCPQDTLNTMAIATRAYAQRTFSIDAVADRYLTLYQSLVAGNISHDSIL